MICETCGKEHDGKYGSGRFCSVSCANKRKHSKETKLKISKGVKNSEKFLLRNDLKYHRYITIDEIPKKICPICGNQIKPTIYKHYTGYSADFNMFCSQECYNKNISIRNVGKTGGFFENTVKNYKSGWYKGIYCDSSWELAFVYYHIDNKNNISRCKEVRLYYDENNKEHKFYPDFIVNGKIYEIKGRQDKFYKYKMQYNSDVTFIFKEDIKLYLDYIINKIGVDFIKIYDCKK